MPAADVTAMPVLVQPSDRFRNGLAALATRDRASLQDAVVLRLPQTTSREDRGSVAE